MDRAPEALLVTGKYGTGKTTLIEELAELVEGLDLPYAAIDVDWLSWTNAGRKGDGHGVDDITVRNLASVVGAYLEVGARYFLLARAVQGKTDVDRIREAVGMPVTVIRLTVPLEEIERRLSSAVASGRANDLAAASIASEDDGAPLDAVFANDRPIGELAAEVLAILGWRAEV